MNDKQMVAKAIKEGRVCAHCGWMINKKRWQAGKRLCASCEDALRGVYQVRDYGPYFDEPRDPTGES